MKKLGLWLMTILVTCLSFISVACSSNSSKAKDEITLNETAITLEVGATQTLTATTNVDTAIEWSTSDAAIATVDGGVVSAVSAGTATITAKAGTATATCTVKVNEVQEYAEVTVDKTVVELKEGGDSVSVNATFMVNDEARDCDFVWTSENEEVATVDNGNVIPVGVGSTVITVSVEYKGETYSADVEVEVKPDEQIQVSKGIIELALVEMNGSIVSDTFTAVAYKTGVENTEVTLEYASSDETVAIVTVNAGVATVTSVGEGSCTISVYYTSAQGKIETLVNVIVARSTLVLEGVLEIPYVQDNTVLDVSALELIGELECVYAEGEKIAAADGVLDTSFVEKNKGVIVPVEVRTTVAIYQVELLMVIPYVAEPKQEEGSRELVDAKTYAGDPTELGFPAGTETAYELIVDAVNGKDGWTSRMFINADTGKDAIAFDVIVTELAVAGSGFRFTMWPANNTFETQGSYGVNPTSNDPSADADANRKLFVLGEDDEQPSAFVAGVRYTVYFFFNKGETHVHFSMFTDGTMYIANIRGVDADEIANDPTLPPPPISQGEARKDMPTYDGDVTALGFEAGTVVYEVAGPQGNANDVKLVAQVDASGDNAYAKLNFVLSAPTTSLGLWITAVNTHLGYYTVTPTGFTGDSLADSTREIFVTDANGASVTSFEANTMYTLYVGLDGREATIQLTTWAQLSLYIANIACVSEAETPFEPTPPVEDGKEISILFIGNSFSDDTETYMIDILLSLGYTNVDVGNLYIGGCDIDTHYSNILNNTSAYDFRMRSHNGNKYTEYETTTVGGKKRSIDFAIAYRDWDIISIQQASGYSGQPNTYSNLDALMGEVKKKATNPDVEFVFNMTWAYQANSTHSQFPDYNSDQMTMYNAIVNATQTMVKYTVVPNGTAIQNARTSYIGDTLTRDGYHLNLKIGRLIAGLTFVAKVTGEDITNFTYAPSGVAAKELAVAIESVQNAIATPFAVTESQYKGNSGEIPDDDADITAGGSNKNVITIYKGDETELGFEQGSVVYQYVGLDSATDKASIKVDSVTYDYVEVQFVIAQGDGYFFMHALKNNVWHNNGASYVVDPSWIRIADGNNTPSDRIIQIFDADGNQVTSLMKTGVLYTLRVFTKVGEIDEITISKAGSTIYFANVKQGFETEIPTLGPIKQGGAALPTYTGDETARGFAEGEFLQYMVTETIDGEWWQQTSLDSQGRTREQLAAGIPAEAGKYVTIKFAASEDIASGSVFYVWGLLGNSYTQNGGVNFDTTTYGRILDLNGKPVTSISKNTVYVLELYMEGTDTYKVANICATGMELYFASDSIAYSDTATPSPEPDPTPDPEPTNPPIVSGEASSTALNVYNGDVTALGFASGTTVYQLVSKDTWNDRVKIATDCTYKYLDVQFVVTDGAWYFNVWVCNENGMLDGSYLVAELGGGKQHAVFGDGFAMHSPNSGGAGGNTRIQILDANGNPVIGGRDNGNVYTMRVWLQDEDVASIQIGQSNVTMYFGKIECTNEEPQKPTPDPDPTPDPEPTTPPIVSGETSSTALNVYNGDVTALGFASGTTVYQLVSKDLWNDRVKIATDYTYKYVDIQFMVADGPWYFNIWICNENGMLDGSYLVAELGGGRQHAVFGDGFAMHSPNSGGAGGNTRIQILDANGNPVIGGRDNGTVYTMRIWLQEESVTEVQIGQVNVTMYFGNIECTNEEPQKPTPDPDSTPDFEGAVTKYDGDVTALGFAAGSKVYKYVGVDSSKDKVGIKVDSVNYDFVEVQFVIAEGPGYFFMHGLKGGNWHNNGASYVIDPSWIRIADGNNTPSDRVIEIFDANGNKVNTLMKTGVLYTLRVFTKVGDLDEITISQSGATMYFANVTQDIEDNLPVPDAEPIKQGDARTTLEYYTGDVTALGFVEGTKVQQLVGKVASGWGEEIYSERAVVVGSGNQDYIAVDFILANDYTGVSLFHIWPKSGAGSFKMDGTNAVDTAVVSVVDKNGLAVTAIEKGKIYTLRVYDPSATHFGIGVYGLNTIYFANVVSGKGAPAAPLQPVTAAGSNKNAVTVYEGDETALGFAAGSTVFKYTGETSNDKLGIKVDSANYDYVDIQIVFDEASTKTWFLGFVMKGSSYLNGADAYILSADNVRFNANPSTPLDRTIQFLDADGNVVKSVLKTGVVYTLRIYIKAGNVTEIQMRQIGVTAYFANVTLGVDNKA